MFTLMLLAILFGSVAMLIREGLWSNLISLVNVITAALLATSLWEPVAVWLESLSPTYTYLFDFLALWMVFCGSMIVLRAITDKVSKMQVRFPPLVNILGGGVAALWVGWILVSFTTMTFHTAPLARNFMGGPFKPDPTASTFLMFAPDHQWLGFVQSMSRGSLATSSGKEGEGDAAYNVFDPKSEFIYKYGQRRADFEKEPELRVRRD